MTGYVSGAHLGYMFYVRFTKAYEIAQLGLHSIPTIHWFKAHAEYV